MIPIVGPNIGNGIGCHSFMLMIAPIFGQAPTTLDPIGVMILSHFVVFGGGLDFGHLDNI